MNKVLKLSFLFLFIFLFHCKKDEAIVVELTEKQIQQAEYYHNKAVKEYSNTNNEEALININKAIDISHSKNSYSFKRIILLTIKDYKELLKTTTQALNYKHNQFPESYLFNGYAYELNNQYEEAKKEFRKALEIWDDRKENGLNYPEILTEKPFLIAVLKSKEEGLNEYDFLAKQLIKKGVIKEEVVISMNKKYRTMLQEYDNSGMTFFFKYFFTL